ncbi:putative family transcriptional regulator protein [Achaetomium macrosporum]|uniref:Family transcriptional regulator protein n=1 Tax=Achaetomium macrosporum TaxID=79813 RepID=A0AAN7C0T3_9PEZI|nr:putative family transcriptional regulator protein [Achaetomium macrosporum]
MSKILTVFGATGVQGGSVIRSVLADPALSKTFKIRAVTRDVSKASAQALAQQGIEVTAADMGSRSSVDAAVKGTHTLFLVTLPDMVTGAAAGTETAHGKTVADAAKAAGVQHLVFSSLINVTEASHGKLPHVHHFDSKAHVEDYIRAQGIPATFIQPGYYMTNFTNLGLLRRGDDGSYTLAGPTGATKAQLPLIFPGEDMGKYFVAVAKNPAKTLNKTIPAAADYYTPARVMDEFTQVTGRRGQYVQLDHGVYKGFLPPPIAQEILENELLCEDPGFFAGAPLTDGHALLAEVGLKVTTWREYLEARKGQFE